MNCKSAKHCASQFYLLPPLSMHTVVACYVGAFRQAFCVTCFATSTCPCIAHEEIPLHWTPHRMAPAENRRLQPQGGAIRQPHTRKAPSLQRTSVVDYPRAQPATFPVWQLLEQLHGDRQRLWGGPQRARLAGIPRQRCSHERWCRERIARCRTPVVRCCTHAVWC